MTITDIDKQFDENFLLTNSVRSDTVFKEEVRGRLPQAFKDFLHYIYSQAKAEQREEDAMIAEKMKELKYPQNRFFDSYTGVGSYGVQEETFIRQANKEDMEKIQIYDDIASEIRGQHD